jgi:hypothetical protein
VTDYKDRRIEIQTKQAPDVEGWRVYVMVSAGTGDAVRTVPLSFTDGRTFKTEQAAATAGLELAWAWIDGQG